MSEPTFAQEDYAEALVERLRAAHLLEAEAYARKVERCQDRLEMSCLIDEMKTLVQEAEEEP
jgi:hypothetical protein